MICKMVMVPPQPTVNCRAEVFILVNYLHLGIVDDSVSLGWRVFPKVRAHIFGLYCIHAYIRLITVHQVF